MSSLIENVLDVYRLGKGVVQIDRKLTDMNELLRNCYQDSKVKAHEQQIQLKISMVQLPALFVDDRQLSRVFANLVENALKFTPRLGKVKICAALEDEMLVVSVSDSGIGIKESDLSQIFQKYFRAKNAAGYKGTGLGLTISKAIVEAHGGVIEVFSRVGEGSTFTVKLPVGMELQNETGHSVPLPVSGREYKKV
jgi:signal transduction histidine kinase